ncbi:MAG TPA: hypothetical protein PLS70_16120, partial [Acidobacteriota bacterium]|nr:hypothetical protein [Acidobacteriota bacterium]
MSNWAIQDGEKILLYFYRFTSSIIASGERASSKLLAVPVLRFGVLFLDTNDCLSEMTGRWFSEIEGNV